MANVTKVKAMTKEEAAAKSRDLAKAGASKLKGGASGFMTFIREQNIVGLAVGLVLGTQAGATVNSLSETGASLSLGAFINDFINFVVLAFVIYLVIKLLKLDVKK